jgi:ABC-type transport system involved in Fe-S cluster assembly fused permease/ATPase subunit
MRPSRSHLTPTSASWSSLTDLLPYLLEFRARIAIALVCLVAAKLASVGLPFVLKDIVDQLDTKTSQTALLVLPLSLLLAYGMVRFANVLFGQLRDTLFGRVTERAMRRVGYKVFAHLHALDLAFHLDRRTGGLSRDIERGVNGISFLMRFMVFNIVPTFLEFGLVIGLLAWNYEPAFALIVFVAVVTYIGFSVVATEWRTRFIREVNLAESRSSTRSIDSLINFETVKYFTNEQYESDHYDTELANWEDARRRNRLTLFALNAGQTLIIAIATTLAMILAGANVVDGTMTIGDFVLINAMMIQVFVPLNFLGFVYREMKSSLANIEAMFALLKIEPKVKDAPQAKSLAAHDAKIEFTNVSFAYQPEREIIHKVNFVLEPRQKLAIVGSSGSGKSTIMKLLFRFYDCTSGSIFIDGQNINSVSQASLRAAIGVVPQDTVLFNASIFDNIRYGRVDASDDDVWEAIRMAHLYDFIERLPEREKTRVGERGLKLSGGEKQRVAIARAVLKRPPIMIFDEATSSLDSQSEQSILAAIAEIAREHTSVVIAHRLSTIVDADSIVVLEQGHIIEQGTHAQLLSQGGKYFEMWTIQQKNIDASCEASWAD